MYLNAYYIHQYHYVAPPRHVEYDCAWMKDHGFDALSFVINEIDLDKTALNIDLLFNTAKKHGLEVHLVPSRWGAVVAGTPGMKSIFSATHKDICLCDEDGVVIDHGLWGPMASINHPATMEFFQGMVDKLFQRWPFDGIVWDEPKLFDAVDHTEAARKIRPPGAGVEWDNERHAWFFDQMGAYIRGRYPETRLSMFIYGHLEEVVPYCMAIEHLDDFGCDGPPFPGSVKSLTEHAPYFMQAARQAGKRSLMLIENFGVSKKQNRVMDEQLPEILGYGIDHLLAYYYGRNCEDPDQTMAIIAKHLSLCR